MTDNNVVTMPEPVERPEKEWLSLEEAAGYLEKSTRHVQRLATASLVATKMFPRAGQRPERMYHAPSLLRCKTDAVTAPMMVRQMPEPSAGDLSLLPVPLAAQLQQVTNAPALPWANIIPEIAKYWTMATQEQETSKSGHVWLTIDEAHTYCRASKARILKAAQAGVLVAIKDPAWKVRRSSLDAWDGGTGVSGQPVGALHGNAKGDGAGVGVVKKSATKTRKRH